MVVRRTRIQPSRAEPSGKGTIRQDVPCHVRWSDTRPRHRTGKIAVTFSTSVHAKDILCGFRLGSRRSGLEDGRTILVCSRTARKE